MPITAQEVGELVMFFRNYISNAFGPACQKWSHMHSIAIKGLFCKDVHPPLDVTLQVCLWLLTCLKGTKRFAQRSPGWPQQQRPPPLLRYCAVEVCTPFSTEQPFVFRQAETRLFINSYTTQPGRRLGIQGPSLFSLDFKPSDNKGVSMECLNKWWF